MHKQKSEAKRPSDRKDKNGREYIGKSSLRNTSITSQKLNDADLSTKIAPSAQNKLKAK